MITSITRTATAVAALRPESGAVSFDAQHLS